MQRPTDDDLADLERLLRTPEYVTLPEVALEMLAEAVAELRERRRDAQAVAGAIFGHCAPELPERLAPEELRG